MCRKATTNKYTSRLDDAEDEEEDTQMTKIERNRSVLKGPMHDFLRLCSQNLFYLAVGKCAAAVHNMAIQIFYKYS